MKIIDYDECLRIGHKVESALREVGPYQSLNEKTVLCWQIIHQESPNEFYTIRQVQEALMIDRLEKINAKVDELLSERDQLKGENKSLREIVGLTEPFSCRHCQDSPPAGFTCNACGRPKESA